MPTAGTPYTIAEIARGLMGFNSQPQVYRQFTARLKQLLKTDSLALVNSGTTANYLLYQLFLQNRNRSEQDEVLMPAYTAPSLLLPLQAAGLRCRLVDIDPETFNIDRHQIAASVNRRTLAIMPVHMFGLPCDVPSIMELVSQTDIFVVEDAASSFGSQLGDRQTGTLAPFGFYSLNRGKNISTLAGGIITWQDHALTSQIKQLVANLPILTPGERLMQAMRLVGLSLAVRPFFYTLLGPLVARYKYTTLHSHFDSFGYTPLQAALGERLFRRAEALTERRVVNGRFLRTLFSTIPGVVVARELPNARVAYNQFPVVIANLEKRSALQTRLLADGLETTLLYEQPLHEIFPHLNPGGTDPFPAATYLARHLLLIPSHAQIGPAHWRRITAAVRYVFG